MLSLQAVSVLNSKNKASSDGIIESNMTGKRFTCYSVDHGAASKAMCWCRAYAWRLCHGQQGIILVQYLQWVIVNS